MNMVDENRIGAFYIAEEMIRSEPDEVARVLTGKIVVHCDQRWGHSLKYLAFSPDFDPIPLGEEAPDYDCILNREWGEIPDPEDPGRTMVKVNKFTMEFIRRKQ